MVVSNKIRRRRLFVQMVSITLLSLYLNLSYCEISSKQDKTSIAAPAKPATLSPSITGADFLQVFFGLVVVVTTIIAVLWAIRRLSRYSSSANNQLRIIGGINLGARERLLVVQVGEQQLVLGVAPGSIRTLHVLEHPIIVEMVPDKFAQMLKERAKQIFGTGDKK